MKISVKRFFNNASESYDNSADIQRIIAAHLAASIDTTKPYGSILEIGTGTGFLTEHLKADIDCQLYTHLDMAFELMLSVRNSKTHLPCMAYINADAEFLPFKKNRFDLMISSSTFQWLEHPETSIPNMIQLLKPGSPFHFSIFGDGTFFEMKEISKMTDFGSVMPLNTADFYQSILNDIENIEVSIETKSYIVHYDSVIQFLKHHKKTGARYTASNKPKGKKSFNAFCQLYTDIFSTDKGVPVTYNIHYIKGVKR